MMTLAVGLVAGCRAAPSGEPVLPPPATVEMVQELRDRLQQVDPNARVGLVTYVGAEQKLATVGQTQINRYREGDIITFLDSAQVEVARGRVVRVGEASVVVQYEPHGPSARDLIEGDIAVAILPAPGAQDR
jgi:hypothetical protein